MCGDRRVYRHLPERVLRQYGYVQSVPRHPSDVVELSPTQIVQDFVDFRTHTLKAVDWDIPRPPNEKQIIAEQWERYEARSSPDIYDMVSGVVAYSDAQMGLEEVMSPQQWFQAMSHVKEQITPILARRRGHMPRRGH
uniref:IMP dehydrogenase/GMP reductase, putative n=1 Tax=Medicago truncatula TaxID=3880 RepID=Q1STQ4_MEDTR|nr:IMP dehydrogenase/GMP reductase, putative [Medicago truncatula]